LSRYDHLKSKIATTSSRAKAEIEVLRRRLINAPKPTPQVLAHHVQSLSRESSDSKTASLDTPDILELWDRIHNFLTGLLSSSGILGEILEFYRTVQSFIEGKAQRTLPTGYNGDSRKHHRLSDQGVIDLRKGVIELTEMVRESISSFISDPPLEDLSALQSPNPGAPSTPRDSRFAFDAVNTPPQASRLGEPWEAYAFWPPWANSHSGVHNLAKLLTIVGSAAGEMAAISPPGRSNEANMERLRGLVSSARERCVKAICAAWNKDAENIKTLEDWKRSSERKELTKMPSNFAEFESAVLSGLQRMLYIPEAIVKPGTEPVVLPPPTKLLVMVRSQFVTTLYKALSGMVENAESSGKQANDEWNADEELLVVPYGASSTTNGSSNVERVSSMVHSQLILLTLSGYSHAPNFKQPSRASIGGCSKPYDAV
jgi:exocyst complex component 2